jgi:hypothetical protein
VGRILDLGVVLVFMFFVICVIAATIAAKVQSKKDRKIIAEADAKANPPLKQLTKEYLEIEPDLQDWFALNSSIALGISVDEFKTGVEFYKRSLPRGIPMTVKQEPAKIVKPLSAPPTYVRRYDPSLDWSDTYSDER